MAPQLFLGKYLVQEEIARGGMGVIYKALDRSLNRVVAIKQIHAHLSGDSSFSERFMREARAMARLQHDNIVTIYSVEEDQQTQFLVMEFFGPTNLRTLIRHPQRLPLRDVVKIGHQLSSALAYAHTQGIIHRDIKPANVLIDKRSKVKLTDFGIAAALDEASITSIGQIIGTPEYMSPEQARGVKLDGRSDLYSLGIILYEMLTGHPPYAEVSKTAILGKLAFEQQEVSLQFATGVPAILQGVIRDLLRRNPEDRLPDAETLASQLNEILYTLPYASPIPASDSESTIALVPPASTVDSLTRVAEFRVQSAEPTTQTSSRAKAESVEEQTVAGKSAQSSPRTVLDETRVLGPPQPSLHSASPPYKSAHSSPNPAYQLSSTLVPIIGGAIVLLLGLGGLLWFMNLELGNGSRGSVSGRPSDTDRQPIETESNHPLPQALTAQAEEIQRQRKQLEEEAKRLEDRKRLAEAQAKEDAERREQERQRDRAAQRAKEEEQKRRAAEEEKTRQAAVLQAKQDAERLEQERQRVLQQAKDEEQRRKAEEEARLAKERYEAEQKRLEAAQVNAAEVAREEERRRIQFEQQQRVEELARLEQERQKLEARRLQEQAELKRIQAEREKLAQAAREEEQRQKTQLEETRRNKQTGETEAMAKKDVQVAGHTNLNKASTLPGQGEMDPQLSALLDRFRAAYEGHDLPGLQAMSQMNEARMRSVTVMFGTYPTIKTSVQNLTISDNGATATIVIEQAIRDNGEVVKLSPLAKNIRIRVAKQGSEWGRIVW